jgi:hypothetical protein
MFISNKQTLRQKNFRYAKLQRTCLAMCTLFEYIFHCCNTLSGVLTLYFQLLLQNRIQFATFFVREMSIFLYNIIFPVALQSSKDLGCLTYRRFLELFRHGRTPQTSYQPVARPLPTQDNTTQKDADKHPCLKRDSNPRSSNQPAKTHASDRTATVTGLQYN